MEVGTDGRTDGGTERGKEGGTEPERSWVTICIHLLDPHGNMPRQSVISKQQHKLSH